MRFIQALLLLLVFLLPLTGAFLGFGFEQAKLFLFLIFITLAGSIWLFKQTKFNPGKTTIPALVFILILGLTSFTGIDSKSSLLGQFPYYQGLITYAFLLLFYLLVGSLFIKIEYWSLALVGSSIIVAIIAIVQWLLLTILKIDLPTYNGRIISTFGQPNLFAGFLFLVIPFAVFLLEKKNLKLQILGGLNLGLAPIAIILSQSRWSIFLMLIFFLVQLFSLLQIPNKFKLLTLIFFLVLSLSFSYILSSGIIWQELLLPKDNQWLANNSPEKRIYIWREAGKVIQKSLWLGYGLENLDKSFSRDQINLSYLPANMKDLAIDRAHNYLLDLLLSAGVIGLACWLYFVYCLIKKPKPNLLSSALICYLFFIQLQVQSIVHLVYFWLIAALIEQTKGEKH